MPHRGSSSYYFSFAFHLAFSHLTVLLWLRTVTRDLIYLCCNLLARGSLMLYILVVGKQFMDPPLSREQNINELTWLICSIYITTDTTTSVSSREVSDCEMHPFLFSSGHLTEHHSMLPWAEEAEDTRPVFSVPVKAMWAESKITKSLDYWNLGPLGF